MKNDFTNYVKSLSSGFFLDITSSMKVQGSKRSLDFGITNKDISDLQATPLDGSIEVINLENKLFIESLNVTSNQLIVIFTFIIYIY